MVNDTGSGNISHTEVHGGKGSCAILMAPDQESERWRDGIRHSSQNHISTGKNALEKKTNSPFKGHNLNGDAEDSELKQQIMKGSCGESKDSQMDDGIPSPSIFLCSPGSVQLEWYKVQKIGAGLANLGNTCFMNTVIQCLTYTPPLANYLLQDEHTSSCKCVEFCMMCELQKHMKQVLDHSGEVIKPLCIYQNLKFIAEHFQFGRQEDAHEFLRFVVENLWRASLYNYDCSGKLDPSSRETTIINHIFGGYNRSQVTCLQCRKKSNKYEHFMDFILDIKHSVHTLEKALEKFIQPELLENDNAYKCPKCNMHVPAAKRFTVHRSPNVATFQLKRFDYNRSFGGKITKHVAYPEKLDLRPFMSERKGEPLMYRLNAVLVHMGQSCNSGHYYCYIRNSNGWWYLMDDARVQRSSLHDVLNQQAYVLFYVKLPKQNGMQFKRNGLSSNNRTHLGLKNKCVGHSNGRGMNLGPVMNNLSGTPHPDDYRLSTVSSSLSNGHSSQSIAVCHNDTASYSDIGNSTSRCLLNGHGSVSSSGNLQNGYHHPNGVANGSVNNALSVQSPADKNMCNWHQQNAQRKEKGSYTIVWLRNTENDSQCNIPEELDIPNGEVNQVPYLEDTSDFSSSGLLRNDTNSLCHDSNSLSSNCNRENKSVSLQNCHNHTVNSVSNGELSQGCHLKHSSGEMMQSFCCGSDSLIRGRDRSSEFIESRANHLPINSSNNTDSESMTRGDKRLSQRESSNTVDRNGMYDSISSDRKRQYPSGHSSGKICNNLSRYSENCNHHNGNNYNHKFSSRDYHSRYLEKDRVHRNNSYHNGNSVNCNGYSNHTNGFEYIPYSKKMRMQDSWQNGCEQKNNYARRDRDNRPLTPQRYHNYNSPEPRRHNYSNKYRGGRIRNRYSYSGYEYQVQHNYERQGNVNYKSNINGHHSQKSALSHNSLRSNGYHHAYTANEENEKWKVNHWNRNWKSEDKNYKLYNSHFIDSRYEKRMKWSNSYSFHPKALPLTDDFPNSDSYVGRKYYNQQKWHYSNRSSY